MAASKIKLSARNVGVFYGAANALRDVNMDFEENQVISLIGPSGCGKSTFLRCINRMNDTIPGCRVVGSINMDGTDIYGADIDPVELRARVGMVFQKPNPFPKSIYDNISYGPRIHGMVSSKGELDEVPEQAFLNVGGVEQVLAKAKALQENA